MIINILSDKTNDSLNWNVRDEYKGLSIDEINAKQIRLPYAVAVVNLDGSLNIGVILRTAVIFGAAGFFIIGKKKYDKRSTVGAQNYIPISKLGEISSHKECNDILRKFGFFPVYIETSGKTLTNELLTKATPFDIADFRPCFIFGSESNGIPWEIPSDYTFNFKIPQVGVLRSLNVSSAASILMYKFVENLTLLNNEV